MLRHELLVQSREGQCIEKRLDAMKVEAAVELTEAPRESSDTDTARCVGDLDFRSDLRIRRGGARVDHDDVVPRLPAQPDRVREPIQRLVNIDGYSVVEAINGEVRLDRPLLERQLGL